MKLPDLRDFDLNGKRVLVRVDYDVPLRLSLSRAESRDSGQALQVADSTRIENSLPTINHLLSKQAKIILLSHLGRPEGKAVSELNLKPVAESLATILQRRNIVRREEEGWQIGEEIFLRENLRFNPGEEANDEHFAKELAALGEFYFRDAVEKTNLPSLKDEDILPSGKTVYINDAFAVSHREHASIVGLPKLLPHAAGLALLKEVEILSGVLEKPRKPVVMILGGVKEDKLEVVGRLKDWADYILIGGKLPELISSFQFPVSSFKNVLVADLNEEGKDITLETVEKFGKIIEKAGTIVWAGPLGKYEENGGAGGTEQIARAVTKSWAFKVIGGGDTEAALTKFGLVDKIDFVSSGGGAMLEFLAEGDLVGLKALRE